MCCHQAASERAHKQSTMLPPKMRMSPRTLLSVVVDDSDGGHIDFDDHLNYGLANGSIHWWHVLGDVLKALHT